MLQFWGITPPSWSVTMPALLRTQYMHYFLIDSAHHNQSILSRQLQYPITYRTPLQVCEIDAYLANGFTMIPAENGMEDDGMRALTAMSGIVRDPVGRVIFI